MFNKMKALKTRNDTDNAVQTDSSRNGRMLLHESFKCNKDMNLSRVAYTSDNIYSSHTETRLHLGLTGQETMITATTAVTETDYWGLTSTET